MEVKQIYNLSKENIDYVVCITSTSTMHDLKSRPSLYILIYSTPVFH